MAYCRRCSRDFKLVSYSRAPMRTTNPPSRLGSTVSRILTEPYPASINRARNCSRCSVRQRMRRLHVRDHHAPLIGDQRRKMIHDRPQRGKPPIIGHHADEIAHQLAEPLLFQHRIGRAPRLRHVDQRARQQPPHVGALIDQLAQAIHLRNGLGRSRRSRRPANTGRSHNGRQRRRRSSCQEATLNVLLNKMVAPLT